MKNFREKSGLKRNILVVDDEMINREILINLLNSDYNVQSAENGKQALEILQSGESIISLVLVDLLMPVMDGFELISIMKSDETLRTIPVIVMTSEKDAEVKSIKMGAADFITKPYDMPEVILARCERIIELQEDKSIIHGAEKDSLTGLYTRDFFIEYIRQLEKYDSGYDMDIILINIEHFHLINELYGRKKGDDLLRQIGHTLKEMFEDIMGIGCRTEGDSFYIYCKSGIDHEKLLMKLKDGLSETIQSLRPRFRMGIYKKVDRNLMIENRLDRVKIACDRIRGDYSKQIEYYSNELYEKSKFHEKLINDIDDAINNRDLIVFYQPKYAIQGGTPKLASAEALIRWKHPELGMISPGEFIPLFESNGLIQKLDHYVWSETARQIHRWKEDYSRTIPVSVNVSRMDIYDSDLQNRFTKLLTDNNLSAGDLLLEITESAYAENAGQLIDVVESLRSYGFKIEMDDFGSGYSSLNMLTTIPIDALKMDMKFIQNMQKSKTSMKLVELVLEIARSLNVPVIAEGVETEEQLLLLKEMGCDIIQGYYFSKPVPPEEFIPFIEKELS